MIWPISLKRFIDDGFGIRKGSGKDFDYWVSEFHMLWETIKKWWCSIHNQKKIIFSELKWQVRWNIVRKTKKSYNYKMFLWKDSLDVWGSSRCIELTHMFHQLWAPSILLNSTLVSMLPRLGHPGHLIPPAPLSFVSPCKQRPARAPLPLMIFPVSVHFTTQLEIPYHTQFIIVSITLLRLSLKLSQHTYENIYRHFTSRDYREHLHPSWLPEESGQCLSCCVFDHPLKLGTDYHLGKLYPYQLANLPQALLETE